MRKLVAIALLVMSGAFVPPGFTTASRSGLPSQTTEIPRGQIVDKLICLHDETQSYAVYLPSNYTPARKWPVLYAFDPGARGKVPVERYREAAEKYGWIVVGSNNSRNGAFQPSVDAWNAISNDTHERFAIDDQRTYVTGFSGGARLAIYFATRCQDCIAGVIASGAGYPVGITPSAEQHFALFSTTGIEDFNFSEVKGLDEALTRAGMTHRTEVFTGRHEWPPTPVAIEALEWMELQAMKTGKRERDANLIDSAWQRKLLQAHAFEEAKQTYDAYQIYFALNDSFKGLRDVAEVEKKISQLRDSTEVKTAIRDEQQQIKKQREIETRLRGLMSARGQNTANENSGAEGNGRDRENPSDGLDPETRLQGMLAELRKQAGRTEDSGDRRVARRVMDGVFIGLFEQGMNLLQTQKRNEEPVRTFKLATEVNPERAGAFFYLAWAYAADGQKKKSLQALKTAVEKGFSDLSAITGNKAFDGIRDEAQYRQIIQAVQSKH
jgi:predicted esterase